VFSSDWELGIFAADKFLCSIMAFKSRHIGISESDKIEMLQAVGVSSMEALIQQTIPADIRLLPELNIESAMTENDFLDHMKSLAQKNKVFDSYIGLGYYNNYVPPVIQRNIFENPGWYTAYTPYQAEIAQGRLEALLNFQTMVCDLTGMDLANASLLDEGTAAAEAMIMFYNLRSRAAKKEGVNKFFISESCYPQTIDVVIGRASSMGIEVVIGDHTTFNADASFFGTLIQYPDVNGEIMDYKSFVDQCKAHEIKIGVAADILSLVLLEAPASWGADAVFGTTQRFGVPMGYGGPHAAYFATHEDNKRHIPGRIIGVSKDADGGSALRMALQTREQHIKRDKATSNICTAQALLAVMAGMYAVYHGSEGLTHIAQTVHNKTAAVADALSEMGYKVSTQNFFDTIRIILPEGFTVEHLTKTMLKANINLCPIDENSVRLSLDETTTSVKIDALLVAFSDFIDFDGSFSINMTDDEVFMARQDIILDHPVFNSYHSETEMMRYIKRLENKDLSLVHSMIPLGSCTMKLNAASELMPLSWPEFAHIHPFAPVNQTKGYQEIFEALDKDLSEITGFHKVSLQPNSGAQGEYAGLMVIRAYHHDRGDYHRKIVLIPSSAHGTNPASAVMAGMEVIVTISRKKLNNIEII